MLPSCLRPSWRELIQAPNLFCLTRSLTIFNSYFKYSSVSMIMMNTRLMGEEFKGGCLGVLGKIHEPLKQTIDISHVQVHLKNLELVMLSLFVTEASLTVWRVRCSHEKEGCEWIGKLNEQVFHGTTVRHKKKSPKRQRVHLTFVIVLFLSLPVPFCPLDGKSPRRDGEEG